VYSFPKGEKEKEKKREKKREGRETLTMKVS
jgi:hypothetical protein